MSRTTTKEAPIESTLDEIQAIAESVGDLSRAFDTCGNEKLADKLGMLVRVLYSGVHNIKKELYKISDACFQDAQQASTNVLESVLGGIEIGRQQKKQDEDLKAVLEYFYCDGLEVEDFQNQLTEHAIEPMPGVDPEDWATQLTRWEEASVGGTEADEALEWLALNGTKNIYCHAARLALSNKRTKE